MQRLSGVLMVLAGTALGGYMILPSPQKEFPAAVAAPAAAVSVQSALARPTASATNAVKQAKGIAAPVTSANGTRTFSPASPLEAAPAQAAATSTWTTVVTSEPAANGRLTSSKPGDATTRAALASDLQRELTRVGCYSGEINGAWTLSSKKAMQAFMERVNASLPADEPDYILLTLVQGHSANACSAGCPAGEIASAGGRCLPQAVVAQAQRKEDRRAAEDRKAQQQERLAQEQRANEAKRLADTRKAADTARIAAAIEAVPAPKPAVRKSAPPQQTASINTETLPWLTKDNVIVQPSASKPAVAAVTPATPRFEPLAGMMSIGGPRQVEPEVPASAAAVTPKSGPRPAGTETAAIETPAASDTLDAFTAPVPQQVNRPAPASKPAPRINPIAGLPGTKSGPAAGLPGTKSGPAVRRTYARPSTTSRKYRAATFVRRPSPVIVYQRKPKPFTYASNYGGGGKIRRGQPRPGTAHYNLMMTLGGIY